jgi:hypothetical protein
MLPVGSTHFFVGRGVPYDDESCEWAHEPVPDTMLLAPLTGCVYACRCHDGRYKRRKLHAAIAVA